AANGRWLVAPQSEPQKIERRYRDDTLILETSFQTDSGVAKVIDFMPLRSKFPILVRIVEGVQGQVDMHTQLVLRFDYGRVVPWVRRAGQGISAIAGPDAVIVESDVELRGQDLTSVADFRVSAGQRVTFAMTWFPSHREMPASINAAQALDETDRSWQQWSARSVPDGAWRETIIRSLITLKALTYAPTGGIVAAPTMALPEQLGSTRNWDYRFCWLRDATFALLALLSAGYVDEAQAWREWLLRAVAGDPSQLQIVYGLRGERRLTERKLDWLPGYEHARPVRIGNAASNQFQLDVYGELLDAMFQCRSKGLPPEPAAWNLECGLLDFVESAWNRPDAGIWEVRGQLRHFTHSKVMAWVAIDRAVKSVERFSLEGPIEKWRALRDRIHTEVCAQGFDARQGSFVQFYGGQELDAALLMLPLVGFLPVDDPRMRGTIEAIERHLLVDGLLRRYSTGSHVDGLPPGEGTFLACTFWLADNYLLLDRRADAERLFARLIGLRNDVGLLSEEYDPRSGRMLGNFPQALSHIALINTAMNLSRPAAPAQQRSQG
ncbi:MAG TPA: glycoside hydrolase family 15 protein, partial [Pirellulales bacterium]|nr:glycoside hydrolase family 15 protein [Pirellulales bacterium]